MSILKVDIAGGDYGITCETDHGKRYYLFMVILQHLKIGTQTHYVLSDCESSAICMARYQAEVPEWNWNEETQGVVKAIAKKIPLIIQGWGRNQVL